MALNVCFTKWTDIQDIIRTQWLLLPFGAIEQHGPHLPLAVDTILAESIACEVAERVNGIVAPTLPYGARSLPNTGGGPSFPGTIGLPGNLLISLYRVIIEAFVKQGATKIALINGHWENEPFLIEESPQKWRIFSRFLFY